MSAQKIYGLIVDDQKAPITEKTEQKDQCYLCGFSFEGGEDCLLVFSDEELTTLRKIHTQCFKNHLNFLPNESRIAFVSKDTNEVISYTNVKD